MVVKPFIILCYTVFVDLKVHNIISIPIILIVLTIKNVALIYSITNKGLRTVRELPT